MEMVRSYLPLVFLTTNGNSVILSHGGTGAQGYTRTAGVINGAVQKYVETRELTRTE